MKTTRSAFGRRIFIKSAIGTGISFTVAMPFRAGILAKGGRELLSPLEFKKRLEGPIFSFPTPYKSSFEIDYQAVRTMIEGGLKAGIKVFALTSGNNQYDRLSYDEVKELTRVMVESVAGRGLTIAATGPWWTGQAVDYARFAQSVGADAVQVRPPDYGDEGSLFEHFKCIAGATRLSLGIHGQLPLALMKRLLTIDSIVAFKEEFTTDYTVPLYKNFGDRLAIFAGGTKARFLEYYPYGMRAYYSVFSTFAPSVALRFWNSVIGGKITEAREIIYRYDIPFFERFSAPFWRATLEHFGMAKRYERPPALNFSNKQMEEVKAFYIDMGLRPDNA